MTRRLSWLRRWRLRADDPSIASEHERLTREKIYGERRVVDRIFEPGRERIGSPPFHGAELEPPRIDER
jgi:hypothetical protein